MRKEQNSQQIVNSCFHCELECDGSSISYQNHLFCCNGCLQAHLLINQAIACTPVEASISLKYNSKKDWSELDLPLIRKEFVRFEDSEKTQIVFRLPQIHCSSCVYVLEHLNKLNENILKSEVNFSEKSFRATIQKSFALSELAKILDLVGYAPSLTAELKEEDRDASHRKLRIRALAIAGFCFGNIMLFSLPEYFNLNIEQDPEFVSFFRWASVVFALPIFLYSSKEFYINAWSGIRGKFIHIDLPLVFSLFLAFGRSVYEVFSMEGSGYFDSYAGIVFFMLVGRQFQDVKTDKLGLFTNYKSYFPIAIKRNKNNVIETISLQEIEIGDVILIHKQEVIPVDGVMLSASTFVDYSFVTGESEWQEIVLKSTVFAGARNMGDSVLVEVLRTINQSQLGSLWNQQAKQNEWIEKASFTHIVGKWFTIILIFLSTLAFIYWLQYDINKAFKALTTALIVACPCALLLSHTFATGSASRTVSNIGIWVKNSFVWDQLARIKTIYFDKTGTLTNTKNPLIEWHGRALEDHEKQIIVGLCSKSIHPISQSLLQHYSGYSPKDIEEFSEIPGQGICGVSDTNTYSIQRSSQGTSFLKNNIELGHFNISFAIRANMELALRSLSKSYKLGVISGDNENDKLRLSKHFPNSKELHFGFNPEQKMKFISKENNIQPTAYFGDGLNDTGALQKAQIGISVRDGHERFTPAADLIYPGEKMHLMHKLFSFSKSVKRIIQISFFISLLYNAIGLSFALAGELSPLIAALLMPTSTVTIILFTTLNVQRSFKKNFTDEYQRSL
jgi:P-type Cu+ transporter